MHPRSGQREEPDVVVVGFGFAGGSAAIYAADAGATVLLLEKTEHPGGLSITSGGGLLMGRPSMEERVFQCIRAACASRTPDEIVRTFSSGLCRVRGWLEELAAAVGAEIEVESQREGTDYPLPGRDALVTCKIRSFGTETPFPWIRGLRGGARLFKIVLDNVMLRPGISVRYGTRAIRLLVERTAVAGVVVEDANGVVVTVRAKKAVILATGGFEFDEDMKMQHFQAMPVYGVTARGNVGDGIRLAQSAGAALWHMWHFHGSYGFKFAEYPVAFRHPFAGHRAGGKPMPWIAVDRNGNRYMNEFHISPNDTNARPMDLFDPESTEFPRIPSYLIFDERGRTSGPIAFPVGLVGGGYYEWSADNGAEIDRGWIVSARTVDGLEDVLNDGGIAHIPPGSLEQSVRRWNRSVHDGVDREFGRPAPTMMAIGSPPFYATAVWPIVSNTQGGPVHDSVHRVLDVWNQPIPRLYAVGELGSLFGHLYVMNGNLSECFISGRLAGEHAAGLSPLPKPPRSVSAAT